jgi:hypothetical protein
MQISIFKNMFGNNNLTTKTSFSSIEKDNIYFVDFSKQDSSSSNDLEVTPNMDENNDSELVSIIVSNNLKRMRKEYGQGFDQRELEKTCLEKIYDQAQEKSILQKLKKYNYQMNLLKKLENSEVGEFEKIKAIEEYNYLIESSKYISNIEKGGLYSDWNNINDF